MKKAKQDPLEDVKKLPSDDLKEEKVRSNAARKEGHPARQKGVRRARDVEEDIRPTTEKNIRRSRGDDIRRSAEEEIRPSQAVDAKYCREKNHPCNSKDSAPYATLGRLDSNKRRPHACKNHF